MDREFPLLHVFRIFAGDTRVYEADRTQVTIRMSPADAVSQVHDLGMIIVIQRDLFWQMHRKKMLDFLVRGVFFQEPIPGKDPFRVGVDHKYRNVAGIHEN